MAKFSVETVFRAIDRITAPVNRMQQRIGRFTTRASSALRVLGRATDGVVGGMVGLAKNAAALAGVGSLGALYVSITKVADGADALAKTARRLAFPIEELQEWRFVAEQSGVDVSLLESSLSAFTKRLGEAKAGTGALTTYLKKTNKPLLRQLKATEDTSEAFELYLNYIRQASSASDKAAIASAGFSRAGLKLINITHNSAQAIKDMRIEQRQNGVITQAQAEAAEAYNDALNSLKKSLFGLLQTAILPMMPAMTETLRNWREFIVSNRELVALRVKEFFINVFKALNVVKDSLVFVAENKDAIKKMGITFLSLIAIVKATTAALAIMNLVMAANPISLIVVAVGAAVAALAALWVWVDEIDAKFEKLPAIFKIAFAPIYALVKAIKWLKHHVPDIINAAQRATDAVKGRFDDTIGGAKALASDIGDFFAFGKDAPPPAPRVMSSPQERSAKMLEERKLIERTELTIRDETKRAQVTGGKAGSGIIFESSGAF